MQTTFKKLIKHDRGFTLVELSIAMLISGILGSVAVPSYLGLRNHAYDFEAQSGVSSALQAAQAHYSAHGTFSDSSSTCNGANLLADEIQSVEPNFDFVANTVSSNGPRVISIEAQPTYNTNHQSLGCQAFYAAVLSQSGTCWIGRLTIEGKFTSTESNSPIAVRSKTARFDALPQSLDTLELNGNAYRSVESATQCSANVQSDISADSNIQPFFDTWRSITAP
jgi:prepilin-type N-terminal cleavage/methylation domain-containing protein